MWPQIVHIDVVRRRTGTTLLVTAALACLPSCSTPRTHCGGTGKCLGEFGTINGSFREQGGPLPGINQPLSGTITVYRGTLGGPVVTKVPARDGRFQVPSLGPGVYVLVGTSRAVSGVRCATAAPVEVKPFVTVDASVVCSIK